MIPLFRRTSLIATAIGFVASAVLSPSLLAQSGAKIPTRLLGAITATSSDSLGTQIVVRALSDGRVMVNDIARRRVLLFEQNLSKFSMVIDSGSTTGGAMATAVPSAQLIRYDGDSSLYVDLASQALLVIDNSGKVARVMALPRPTDAIYLSAAAFGPAWVDPQGRLVYRGMRPPKINPSDPGSKVMSIPQQSDSGPILRADFDQRRVDTITTLKVLQPGAMTLTQQGTNISLKLIVNPMDTGDEWGMLPDGTIAIVRAHDYHVDWVTPDGTITSSPKMAFDWKPMTDAQKQFKLDSIRPELQKAIDAQPAQMVPTAEGPRRIHMQFDFVPISKLSDYEPSIAPGALKIDPKGNLWIVPRTSSSANGGVLYDVVNRNGEVTERVQFPKGYALVGFGNGGDDVYLLRVVAKVGFLERAKLR